MTIPVNPWFTTPPRPADVHTLDDRCFWCASGAEAAAPAGTGWHWGATTEQCPFWTDATEVTR